MNSSQLGSVLCTLNVLVASVDSEDLDALNLRRSKNSVMTALAMIIPRIRLWRSL